jgi:hypothetical protein
VEIHVIGSSSWVKTGNACPSAFRRHDAGEVVTVRGGLLAALIGVVVMAVHGGSSASAEQSFDAVSSDRATDVRFRQSLGLRSDDVYLESLTRRSDTSSEDWGALLTDAENAAVHRPNGVGHAIEARLAQRDSGLDEVYGLGHYDPGNVIEVTVDPARVGAVTAELSRSYADAPFDIQPGGADVRTCTPDATDDRAVEARTR